MARYTLQTIEIVCKPSSLGFTRVDREFTAIALRGARYAVDAERRRVLAQLLALGKTESQRLWEWVESHVHLQES